jgi:hypothetical protein
VRMAARIARKACNFKTSEGASKQQSWVRSEASTYWVRITTPLLQRRANRRQDLLSNHVSSARTHPPITLYTPANAASSPISRSSRRYPASDHNERCIFHPSRVPYPARRPRMSNPTILYTSNCRNIPQAKSRRSKYRNRAPKAMNRSDPPSSSHVIRNMVTSSSQKIHVCGQRKIKILANPARNNRSSSAMSYWQLWNGGSN